MPIPTMNDGPSTGQERKRVTAATKGKPPKLRKSRSDTTGSQAKLKENDKPSPRRETELDDYDEDKA